MNVRATVCQIATAAAGCGPSYWLSGLSDLGGAEDAGEPILLQEWGQQSTRVPFF